MDNDEATFLFILLTLLVGLIFIVLTSKTLQSIPVGEDGVINNNPPTYLLSLISASTSATPNPLSAWNDVVLRLEKFCKALSGETLDILKFRWLWLSPFIGIISIFLVFGTETLAWPVLAFGIGLLGAGLIELESAKIGLKVVPKSTYGLIDYYQGVQRAVNTNMKAALGIGAIIMMIVTVQSTVSVWTFNHHYLDMEYSRNEFVQMFKVSIAFVLGGSTFAVFSIGSNCGNSSAAIIANDLIGAGKYQLEVNESQNPTIFSKFIWNFIGNIPGKAAEFYCICSGVAFSGMLIFSNSPQLADKAHYIYLPILLQSSGIILLIFIGLFEICKWPQSSSPLISYSIKKCIFLYCAVFIVAIEVGSSFLFPEEIEIVFFNQVTKISNKKATGCLLFGLISAIILSFLQSYFSSAKHQHTEDVLKSCETGIGTGFILGFSFGAIAVVFPILLISASLILAYHVSGLITIWLISAGSCLNIPIVLAIHTLHSNSELNAGLIEMLKLDKQLVIKSKKIANDTMEIKVIANNIEIICKTCCSLLFLLITVETYELYEYNIANISAFCAVLCGAMIPYAICGIVLIFSINLSKQFSQELITQCNELSKYSEFIPDYLTFCKLSKNSIKFAYTLTFSIACFLPVFLIKTFPTASIGILLGLLISAALLETSWKSSASVWSLFLNSSSASTQTALNLNTSGLVLSSASNCLCTFSLHFSIILLLFLSP
jgi:K(+)-stimulated pyrophosphate-energized sodium pump